MYESIAHCQTNNSYGQRTTFSIHRRMTSVAPRLKALREKAQPKISIRKMADELGLVHSTYAAYEDPKKFKKPILPFNLAKKIAGVLDDRGISPSEVMKLAGLQGSDRSLLQDGGEETLKVTGAVAAGIWKEQSDWPEEEQYPLEVGPSPVRGVERFAVRMEGYSMDKTIPPGSDLECLRVSYGVVEPEPGDLVIVERHAHDLTEMTCKRLDREGDEWVLRSESTKPEFQEVIRIGTPDKEAFIDNEVKVIGIVIKAHQSHFRRRTH
jgi:SOS-response transcriptional repressor LexA